MVRGYERAKTEEMVLHKQKDYRKYEKAFDFCLLYFGRIVTR